LSLSANQKHGLRRNRADKRLAVQQALLHPQGAGLSDREIARHCGVDHKTVGRVRSELEASGEIPRITERNITRRDGSSYRQDTAKLNNFVAVDELAEALKQAVTSVSSDLPAAIQRLVEIKRGGKQGQPFPAELAGRLPTPYRPRDLTAAGEMALAALRRQLHRDYEGLCPRCQGAVYFSRDLNGLYCEGCEQTWTSTKAFNNDVAAAGIDGILRETLLTGDPNSWPRHSGTV
jgi:DNA-binding transcriptional regulator YhcF (GntR family)